VLEYERNMEKILDDQENATVVTNPHERFRTFWRKVAYRWQVVWAKLTGKGGKARSGR